MKAQEPVQGSQLGQLAYRGQLIESNNYMRKLVDVPQGDNQCFKSLKKSERNQVLAARNHNKRPCTIGEYLSCHLQNYGFPT